MIGVQRIVTESFEGIIIYKLCKGIIVEDFDFLILMAGTETIKEMQDRDMALDRSKMCDNTDMECPYETRCSFCSRKAKQSY